MKNLEFSALEKEMVDFNFDEFRSNSTAARANLARAASIADIKTEVCNVWSKVRKYVIWAENVPVAGKFIVILADLLDAICGIS